MRRLITFLLINILSGTGIIKAQGTALNPDNINMQELQSKLQKTKIPWVHNSGQQDGQVAYYANTFAGTVFLTKDGDLVYNLPKEKGKANVVKEVFAGANPKNIQASNKAVAKINHFMKKGDSFTEQLNESFYTVSLGKIWDGIEVKLNAYGSNIEKLFFVEPHTDYKNIKIEISDATELKVKDSGELHITTSSGEVAFSAPVAYQIIDGKKVDVEVEYLVSGDSYSFIVGEYDPKVLLVIDPVIASTYLSGDELDFCIDHCVDSYGNIFISSDLEASFYPKTPNSYKPSRTFKDIFIAKFSPDLSQLLAASCFGADGDEKNYGIAIDKNDNVFVVGEFNSDSFKSLSTDKNESHMDSFGYFIAKLDNNLSQLLACNLIGGPQNFIYIESIKVSPDNKINIFGQSFRYKHQINGYSNVETIESGYDIFVNQYSNDLSTNLALSIFGSTQGDSIKSSFIDEQGNIYVAGKTENINFPTTTSPLGSGNRYLFITCLSPDLQLIKKSIVFKTPEQTHITDISVNNSDCTYIAGYTSNAGYPITKGSYFSNPNEKQLSSGICFVTKFTPDFSKIEASTFWGGSRNDKATSILIDKKDNVFLVGSSISASSDYSDYPRFETLAYDADPKEGFIAKFSSDLSVLKNTSYFGMKNSNNKNFLPRTYFSPIATFDNEENIIITGSFRGGLPVKENSYQKEILKNSAWINQPEKNKDIGIFKITNDLAPDFPVINSPENQNACTGTKATFSFNIDTSTKIKYQIDKGNGFEDITDNDIYQGTTTNQLTINNTTKEMDGYLIRCIANNGVSQTISKSIRLDITPSELNITQQPQNVTACEGNTVKFLTSVDNETANYNWYKDTELVGNENELILDDIKDSDKGTYICKVTNICGTEANSTPATLEVLTLNFIENPEENSACLGSDASFLVKSESKNIAYQWKKDGNKIDGKTTNTLDIKNIQASDAGSYSCLISNGCAEKESTTAELLVDIPLEITKQPTDTWGCKSSDVSFITETNGTRPVYQWKKDGILIENSNSTELKLSNISIADLGKYSITVTNTCGTIESQTAELTIPEPNTSAIEGKEKVCFKSQKISYSAEENRDYTFDWAVYNGYFNNANTPNKILVDWTDGSGKGQIKLKVTDNKTNCHTELNKWVDIDDNLPQKPNILIKGDALLLCTDSGMNAYQWYLDEKAIEGADRQFYEIPEGKNGAYHIKVFFENGCGTASDQITTGDKKKLSVKLSPNPTTDILTFQMENSYKGDISYTIYHPSGNIIKNGQIKKAEEFLRHSLNLPQVISGNYLVVFRFEDGQLVSKQLIIK